MRETSFENRTPPGPRCGSELAKALCIFQCTFGICAWACTWLNAKPAATAKAKLIHLLFRIALMSSSSLIGRTGAGGCGLRPRLPARLCRLRGHHNSPDGEHTIESAHARQLPSKRIGLVKRFRARGAPAGDVVCGALRRSGDRERQSPEQRDAAGKPEQFHRDLPLVVIHGEDGIER